MDGKDGVETTSQYLGLIFAVFMVSVMVGSSIFQVKKRCCVVLFLFCCAVVLLYYSCVVVLS
jgi:hypothetical protein